MLTKHLHDDPATCVSSFLTAHGVDVDDLVLDNPDIMFHLMDGYCANYATPVCSEILRCVESFINMAIAVTKIITDKYAQGQLSSENLRVKCSVIGSKAAPHK